MAVYTDAKDRWIRSTRLGSDDAEHIDKQSRDRCSHRIHAASSYQ